MAKRSSTWLEVGLSALALGLAAVRVVVLHDPDDPGQWFDSIFLLLVLAPVAIFLVPWRRLESIGAAGFEIQLHSPSVQGALSGIDMSQADSRAIRRVLFDLGKRIDDAKGSRVLWIDDNPEQIVGERRLLRALDVHVVSASSSERARAILVEDNDFDLVITDLQRAAEPGERFEEFQRYGGIVFIQELRQWKREQEGDPIVQELPVVAYTAYTDEQVRTILRQVSGEDLPDVHVCHSTKGLLQKVFALLPAARAEAVKVPANKPPTDIREP